MIRAALVCGGLLLGAVTCFPAEMVCLKSGFCLRADAHEVRDQNLSLRIGAGNIEFPAGDIASIQTLSEPPAVTGESSKTEKVHGDPQAVLGQAADIEGVDRDFVRSVARIESDFQQKAVSNKGAIGLMQIMPSTAKELHVDATEEQQNALGGAKYLRMLLLRYHGNSALALAAYNAGPGAVQRFGGVPPYKETRSYIMRVTRDYDQRHLKSAQPGGAANRPIAKD